MRRPETESKPASAEVPAPEKTRPRVPVWLLAVLLVLVTIALYWPATRCNFISCDDPDYVTANPHVQGGLNWESFKWAFRHPVSANWHPLTVLSHMLDCQLFGLNPWGHHLTNLLFHSLNAALVFILLCQLTGAVWRSLLVAALFAVHPLHVESVAWVAERKDVLSVFFGLLSLIFYVRYARGVTSDRCRVTGSEGVGGPFLSRVTRHTSLFYILAFVFLALGLMSKPMLVTWPFVMLLLDYWPLGRLRTTDYRPQSFRSLSSLVTRHTSLIFEKLPFLLIAAVASCVTVLVQQHGGAFGMVENLTLGARIGNALVSYCRYLGKMIWPADLAVFYPHTGHWPSAIVLLAGLLLVVISTLFFVKRRRYPFLLIGWLWFCGTLVPVIGFVQVGGQAMADRYTYIPSVGVLVLVVWGLYEFTRCWRRGVAALSVAGLAAVVLCLELTRQQLGHWKDSETLFRYALEVTEENYFAYYNLGIALDKQGQIDDAISQYREASRLQPDYAQAHNNLGTALDKKGQTDEAIRQFQEAIRVNLDYAEARYNLGTALEKKGQIDEAIRQLQEAVRLKPGSAEIHYNLGTALEKKGQIDEAIRQLQEAVRLKPGSAEIHYNLGTALEKKGLIDEAISQLREAIGLQPDNAEAHNNLGTALEAKGQTDEAISQYQEAIGLQPDNAEVHNNLGVALAAKGRLDEAIQNYRKAIQINPNSFEALNNLGTTLAAKGQLDDAIESYRKAIRINSTRPGTFVHLGMALEQSGRPREAVTQYQEALRLNPDLVGALNNLAWILAASSEDGLRNGAEAVRLAEHACELTHYAQPLFIGTLAAAYAEAGRFADAVSTAEKAEQLATKTGLTAVAVKNRQLLELYRAGKPHHEPAPNGQK